MSEDFTGTADVPSAAGVSAHTAARMSKDSTGTADVPSAADLSVCTEADKMSAVPVKLRTLDLQPALHDQLLTEARTAFPRECCGLIEGIRRGNTIEATALHPTRNLATESDRFEIDPAEHIRLLRNLRGTGREIIGCYHSHPNGGPAPSPRDRERAVDEDLVWLIASVDASGASEAAAFVFRSGDFAPLRLA
jgi:desampylase